MSELVQAKEAISYHLKEENKDSAAALRAIAWSFFVDAGLAVLGVVVMFLDQLSPLIAASVPAWAAALVVTGLAAIKAALSKYLAGKHTGAVVQALATEPPDAIKRAYGVK